jgi:hydrogenase maturation protease
VPRNIEVLDGGTCGFNLLPLMMGRERIIIIDALLADGAPGSVYRFPVHCVRPGNSRSLVPPFNIRDLVTQVRFAGERPEVEVIGVVPEDVDSLEIGLSDSVKNSLPSIVREVLKAAAV